jgi:hypothetical protein
MSMKLNAGDVIRQDEFLIDPEEILVDEALNGRWQPHDDQAIENMVKSFEDEGQLQASRSAGSTTTRSSSCLATAATTPPGCTTHATPTAR